MCVILINAHHTPVHIPDTQLHRLTDITSTVSWSIVSNIMIDHSPYVKYIRGTGDSIGVLRGTCNDAPFFLYSVQSKYVGTGHADITKL